MKKKLLLALTITALTTSSSFAMQIEAKEKPIILKRHISNEIMNDSKSLIKAINALPTELQSLIKQCVIELYKPTLLELFKSIISKNSVELKGHRGTMTMTLFSPNGNYILTASSLNSVPRLWNVRDLATANNSPIILTDHYLMVSAALFSNDSKFVFTGSDDKIIRVWNLENLAEISASVIELKPHRGSVLSLACSPNGKFMLSGHTSGVCLWTLSRLSKFGSSFIELIGHTSYVTQVVFSPDNKFALTGSYDGTARLWNLDNLNTINESVIVLKRHRAAINSVALSPDSKFALTGSFDTTARLWNLRNLNTIQESVIELKGHKDLINSVEFSPDGKFALTGSFDNSCILWNLENLNKINESAIEISGHINSVMIVACSPDSKFALTGSYNSPHSKFPLSEYGDGTVRLWNLNNLGTINSSFIELKGHTNSITRVAFSQDGRYALTASRDSTARLWTLLPDLTLEQFALIAKLDHLTKNSLKADYLFTDEYYLNIVKEFDPEQQDAIVNAFNLDPNTLPKPSIFWRMLTNILGL